jgi:hypothetical protein
MRSNFVSNSNSYASETNNPGVSVHGGFPNPGTDASLQGLDLNRLLVNNGTSTFMMRIKGNQWEAQGIFAGDIALVDRALTPSKNDLVIWWHEDEFAVSAMNRTPKQSVAWGVVTAVIHQFKGKRQVARSTR